MNERADAVADQYPWTLLRLLGCLFLIVGLAGQLEMWLPLRFGVTEWEYATISQSLDTIPLVGLGLAFLIANAAAIGSRRWVITWAITCVLLAVLIWVMAVVYLAVIPLVSQAVQGQALALTQLKKAGAKTAIQSLGYPIVLIWLAMVAWRRTAPQRASAR